jgi:hypothetical protein
MEQLRRRSCLVNDLQTPAVVSCRTLSVNQDACSCTTPARAYDSAAHVYAATHTLLPAAPELLQAMQHAQLPLSPSDAQHLMAALTDNVGLLNYKKLTRQLKGRITRPASASAAPASSAQATQPVAGGAPQQQQRQRPLSAMPGGRSQRSGLLSHVVFQAAADVACLEHTQQDRLKGSMSHSKSAGSRPSTASARPCAAAAASSHGSGKGSAKNPWSRCNKEGVSVVSHWFCGSRRDGAAAAETLHWRPGPAADGIIKGWGLHGPAPWDGAPAAAGAAEDWHAGCAGGALHGAGEGGSLQEQGRYNGSTDIVPAWMCGADAVHGTCRISQPFGSAPCAATVGEMGMGESQQVDRQQEGVTSQVYPAASSSTAGSALQQPAAAVLQRPASAGPCYRQAGRHVEEQQQKQQQPQQQEWTGPAVGSNSRSKQLQPQRPLSAGCSVRRPSSAGQLRCAAVAHKDLVMGGSSTCGVGLAERRRLLSQQQQDLLAVRMLE